MAEYIFGPHTVEKIVVDQANWQFGFELYGPSPKEEDSEPNIDLNKRRLTMWVHETKCTDSKVKTRYECRIIYNHEDSTSGFMTFYETIQLYTDKHSVYIIPIMS